MGWRIEFENTAKKEFSRLDHQARKRIQQFLRERLVPCTDPRMLGGPLKGSLSGLWKYRVGNYMVIVDIQDEVLIILVLRIGHRRKVYGGH